MQSVAKSNDGSNIYKLSDHANGDQNTSSDRSDDSTKKPAATELTGKEPSGGGGDTEPPGTSGEEGARVTDRPASADDALAWLKIIQNATADLTADVPKRNNARIPTNDGASFGRNPSPTQGRPAASPRRKPAAVDPPHDDYSDERRLAQRFAYRNAAPSQSPQTLTKSAMPYVAATGVLAFLAGSAVVYFLMDSTPSDVAERPAPPVVETRTEAPLARIDQTSAKKGRFQQPASSAVSGDSPASSWSKAGAAQETRPAEPAASSGDRQGQPWSDTVEAFKQFVRPEQK